MAGWLEASRPALYTGFAFAIRPKRRHVKKHPARWRGVFVFVRRRLWSWTASERNIVVHFVEPATSRRARTALTAAAAARHTACTTATARHAATAATAALHRFATAITAVVATATARATTAAEHLHLFSDDFRRVTVGAVLRL